MLDDGPGGPSRFPNFGLGMDWGCQSGCHGYYYKYQFKE